MFEQAIRASHAMQLTARRHHGALVPALSGCRTCRTVQMIAAPALGGCNRCENELTVPSSAESRGGSLKALGAPER
jgi:hypothetical protein